MEEKALNFLSKHEEFITAFTCEIEDWPIDRVKEIISKLRLGNEREWIVYVDDILEEIELRDTFADHIIEMEDLRELVAKYFSTLLSFPEIFLFIVRAGILYHIDVIESINIKKLSDIKKYHPDHTVWKVYERSIRTVMSFAFDFLKRRILASMGVDFDAIEILEGELDPYVWDDFEEYMKNDENIIVEENTASILGLLSFMSTGIRTGIPLTDCLD